MDSSDNETELVVRPIEARDAAEVCLLVEQLGYARSPEAILEWIERVAADTRSQGAYVACVGEEIVGWIEISLEQRLQTAPFALIGGLVVKDGFRGRAIGKRLCEVAESWAWKRGVEAIRVTSRSTREDAHRFYLRDGYKVVKTSLVFEKKRPV
jgi:GNAT superfamily N-acetyltransferase